MPNLISEKCAGDVRVRICQQEIPIVSEKKIIHTKKMIGLMLDYRFEEKNIGRGKNSYKNHQSSHEFVER